jgi:hypothetical protein
LNNFFFKPNLGPGDIKDLNFNSENWAVVKAALTSGLYPEVAARFDRSGQIFAHKSGHVTIDSDSVVEISKDEKNEWFIFDEKTCQNVISGVTVVTSLTVFFFAGHNKLPQDILQDTNQGIYSIYHLLLVDLYGNLRQK